MPQDIEDIEATGGNDIDVDSLMDNIERTGSAQGNAPEQKQAAEATPAPQVEPDFEFDVRGQKIKTKYSDPKLKQWVQQGYDYAQRMADYNKNLSKYQELEKSHKTYEEKFKPIDDYAKTNPEWWNHVEQSWKSRENWKTQSANDPVAQTISSIQEKLNQIEGRYGKTIEGYEKIQAEARDKALNEELDNEISGIRKEYPDIDLAAQDESGKTLEHRVLEYANENSIRNFTQAFKLFNHDALVQKQVEKALEAKAKEQKKNKESGLLGRSPAPETPNGLTEATGDLRNVSYEELTKQALREYGIQ